MRLRGIGGQFYTMAITKTDRDLKASIPTTVVLQTDQATARFTQTQKADPRGGTYIRTGAQVRSRYLIRSQNPVVKAAIETLTSAVFWPNWAVQSQTNLDEYPQHEQFDITLVNFLNENLRNLKYDSFDNSIRAILDASMIYGFAISEQIWKSKDGFWRLESLKAKPSFDFDINMDDTDEIESLYYPIDNTNLNPNKFIITTYPYLRDGNPYGVSELESIITDIDALESLEKTFTLGSTSIMDRTVIHYQVLTGKTNDQIDAERAAIESGLAQTGGVIHLGSELGGEKDELMRRNELITMEDRASTEALPAVQDRLIELQKRINRNFGIQDDLGQATVNVGSLAKAQVEFDIFSAKRNTIADFVRSFVNTQIIDRIIHYNFDSLPPGYLPPKWDFQEFEEQDFRETADAVTKLVADGIITGNEARELLGFSQVDESELKTEDEDGNTTT